MAYPLNSMAPRSETGTSTATLHSSSATAVPPTTAPTTVPTPQCAFGDRPPFQSIQFRLIEPTGYTMPTSTCSIKTHNHYFNTVTDLTAKFNKGDFLALAGPCSLNKYQLFVGAWLNQASEEQSKKLVQYLLDAPWTERLQSIKDELHYMLRINHHLLSKLVHPEFFEICRSISTPRQVQELFAYFRAKGSTSATTHARPGKELELLFNLLPAQLDVKDFFDLDNLSPTDIKLILAHIDKFITGTYIQNHQLTCSLFSQQSKLADLTLTDKERAALIFLVMIQKAPDCQEDFDAGALATHYLSFSQECVQQLMDLIVHFPTQLFSESQSWKAKACEFREFHGLFCYPDYLAPNLIKWYSQLETMACNPQEKLKLQFGLDRLLDVILAANKCQPKYCQQLAESFHLKACDEPDRPACVRTFLNSACRLQKPELSCQIISQSLDAQIPQVSPQTVHYLYTLCASFPNAVEQDRITEQLESLYHMNALPLEEVHLKDLRHSENLYKHRIKTLEEKINFYCRPQACPICQEDPIAPGTQCVMLLPCTHYLCAGCNPPDWRVHNHQCFTCNEKIEKIVSVTTQDEDTQQAILMTLPQEEPSDGECDAPPGAKRQKLGLPWPAYPLLLSTEQRQERTLWENTTEWLHTPCRNFTPKNKQSAPLQARYLGRLETPEPDESLLNDFGVDIN